MTGVEVRIPQILNNDDALGTENPTRFIGNGGAVELWQGGQRIVELVWFEKEVTDIETLERVPELHAAVTYSARVHLQNHRLSS